MTLWWIGLACVAQNVDVEAGIRSETRAGLIPLAPGSVGGTNQGSPLSVDFENVPRLALHVGSRNLRLSTNYSLRVLRRVSTSTSAPSGVLLLHSGGLAMSYNLSRDWNTSLGASFSVGATDFLGVAPAVSSGSGPGNSATGGPAANVVDLFSGGLSGSLAGSVDHRTRTELMLRVSHSRSLGDATETVAVLPSQVSVGGDNNWNFVWDNRSDLVASASAEWINFGDPEGTETTTAAGSLNSNFVNLALRTGFTRRFRGEGGVTIRAGMIGIYRPAQEERGTDLRFAPVFDLSYRDDLVRHRATRLLATVAVGLDGFADPVRAQFVPRATLGLGLTLSLRPRWTFDLQGAFVTPTDLRPPAPEPGVPSLAGLVGETSVGGGLLARYRASDEITVEFGARVSALGPRLRAGEDTEAPEDDFRLSNLTAVGFLGLTGAVTTARVPSGR